MNLSTNKVCIVGAGLVGSMIASYLAQRGISSDIYEKRTDIRKDFLSGNRTIAMSISYRGVKGLNGIGLSDFVTDHTIPKHSRMVHCDNGKIISQKYGSKAEHTINTIDRKFLNQTLLNKAEQSGLVSSFFQHQCESLNPDSGEISFVDLTSLDTVTKKYNWIIGADGLFSQVRNLLEGHKILKTEYIDVHYGYRELLIPADHNNRYQLEGDFVHVWPRDKYIMVGLPSNNGKFTCNLFLPSDGELSLASIQTEEQVLELFNKKFPLLKPLMPTLTYDYFNNAASNINAIKCSNWNHKDKVLLIGDAAHAIVPYFAMGMNTCFEDCTIFDNLMDKYDNDLSKVFTVYGQYRKPDTDAISDLSYKNFSEISKSPDKNYHLKWKLDRTIWDMYPEKWMPCYPMVAFSDIPLSIAVTRTEAQNDILMQAIETGQFDQISNDESFKQIVHAYFDPILNTIEPIFA